MENPRRKHSLAATGRSLAYTLLLACWALPTGTPALAVECASGGISALQPLDVVYLRSYRASFSAPARLSADALGRLYIADPAAGTVTVRAVDGRILTVSPPLGRPNSIAAQADGNRIYVGDGATGRVRAYTPDWVSILDLGQGAGEFGSPSGVAVDPDHGTVWVTDSLEHRVDVYDAADGAWRFGFGGPGNDSARFRSPSGVFIDTAADEALVADQLNGRIQVFDRAGGFKFCIGVKGTGAGRLNLPQGVWADEIGRVYVTDPFEGWVHVIDRAGASVEWIGGVGREGAGPARLRTPTGVAIDTTGRLFVSDSSSARLGMYGLDAYADPERFVPATITLQPAALDPSTPGTAVTAGIEVPGYRLETVEPATLTANGIAALPGSLLIGDVDGDRVPDLTADFDSQAVAATLGPGGGTVRIAGRLGPLELEGFAHLEILDLPGSDGDGDGVPDDLDRCPGTAGGAIVDLHGCDIAQICPCSGPAPGEAWAGHGQYVRCVAHGVRGGFHPPLGAEARAGFITEAARSGCGKKARRQRGSK